VLLTGVINWNCIRLNLFRYHHILDRLDNCEGKCVSGSAGKNHFNLTAPFTDFFLTNKPQNNVLFRKIGRLGINEGKKNLFYVFFIYMSKNDLKGDKAPCYLT